MTLDELPPRIQQYTASHFTTLKTLRLASRHRVPNENIGDFAEVLADIFLKNVEVKNLPQAIKERLKLQEGNAFLLAADSAEQHFIAFEDFFGPMQELIMQWRTWGREFGGREPSTKANSVIERMISKSSSIRGQSFEFRAPKKMTADIPREKVSVVARVSAGKAQASVSSEAVAQQNSSLTRDPSRTVGQAIKTRRLEEMRREKSAEPTSTPVRPMKTTEAMPTRGTSQSGTAQPSGISRDQFLSQLKTLSIDSLRPDGQPAHARLQQLGQQLQHVLTGNPLDRMPIAHAIRSSALFQLYQEMGQESIRSGQPLDAVVYQRFQTNKPYLLKEEFEAMAHLVKAIQ
jgi:hypothetical protein